MFGNLNKRIQKTKDDDIDVKIIRTGKGYMRFETNFGVRVPPAKSGLKVIPAKDIEKKM